jgi:hypothetical protein
VDDSPAPERRGVIDRGVGDPIATLRRGIRVFASPPGQPRSRRATDVVLLIPALLGLALAMAAYPPATFQRSLQRFLASIPDWLDPVWGFFSDLYRMATYYLPPLWGFFAMQWLQRNRYL